MRGTGVFRRVDVGCVCVGGVWLGDLINWKVVAVEAECFQWEL